VNQTKTYMIRESYNPVQSSIAKIEDLRCHDVAQSLRVEALNRSIEKHFRALPRNLTAEWRTAGITASDIRTLEDS
jgi:hypothetical protein